jgi:hypothetical protein
MSQSNVKELLLFSLLPVLNNAAQRFAEVFNFGVIQQ